MVDITRLNKLQSDALTEVVTIGTGTAANALSEMIKSKVLINIPETSVVPVTRIAEAVGREKGVEQVVTAIFFRILGDMKGNILLVLPRESARRLAWFLLEEPSVPAEHISIYDLEKSALMEVGNVITNCYLNAIASITDLTLFPSIPHYAQDVLSAVLDYIMIEIAQESETAILWSTVFTSADVVLHGDFLIFPDNNSMQIILQKLGIG